MLRGYRIYIVALGLVLSSPSYGQETKRNQPESGQDASAQLERIASAIEKQPVASAPDRGCQSGEEDRQSDLCAQWKAADAAADAADWAYYMLWLSVVGIVVGGGTLFAAWRAAHWAKQAAHFTDQSVVHSRETAKIELRAYVDISDPMIEKGKQDNFTHTLPYAFRLHNYGNTPAKFIQYRTFCDVGPRADFKSAKKEVWEKIAGISPGDHIDCSAEVILTREEAGIVLNRANDAFLWLVIDFAYSDVFGAAYDRRMVLFSKDLREWLLDWDGAERSKGKRTANDDSRNRGQ